MNRRKICVVTGTRAEYGLLYWLMKEIQSEPELLLQIIATGMHLSPEFGLTYQTIEDDGFIIDEKVEMLLSSDTPVGIAKSIGLGVLGFADAYARLKPDIVVLLGDRYEILAAAQAAMVARIPIAHIHGGEVTQGAIDDAIRHSITKMSQLHFVATDSYRKRVIQLGENPENVYNYGSLGIENIYRTTLLPKKQLETELDFRFGELNFLVTFHPETLKDSSIHSFYELLKALDYFPDAKIIFTKSNSDTEGRLINSTIDNYVRKNPTRTKAFASLGRIRYLSTLKYIDVVLGNSSSGIIEVPIFKKPTINIGDRQLGRIKATSVIDCTGEENSIVQGIKLALSPEFQTQLKNTKSLYGSGNVSKKIKEVLLKVDLDRILMKKFYDLSDQLK